MWQWIRSVVEMFGWSVLMGLLLLNIYALLYFWLNNWWILIPPKGPDGKRQPFLWRILNYLFRNPGKETLASS